ncbi:MAG: type II toxin-antitoxin system RelE/ParE family toxin [Acidobacteria bacterium]|nr:type II toxin-antitoxin system RelE/ParE family toxin [Acidobacteriota bacterium]
MAKYNVLYTEAFYKSLKSIPKRDVKRILRKTRSLAAEPRPFGCQKLAGQEKYRIRQGDYRIIYSIEDSRLVVVVVKVGNRREVYDRGK